MSEDRAPDERDSAAMELDVTSELDDGRARLRATGEIDASTVSELERRLTEAIDAGASEVTLDLAGVAFMDSSGIRALLHARKALEHRGGELLLASPRPIVVRLLETTGLGEHFPTVG